MLSDLSPDQRRLAEYMSELSERAYCAGWMEGLESALWEVVRGERRAFGRLVFTEDQRQELRVLTERAGGWIIFDDERGEWFLPLEDWKQMYAERYGEPDSPANGSQPFG